MHSENWHVIDHVDVASKQWHLQAVAQASADRQMNLIGLIWGVHQSPGDECPKLSSEDILRSRIFCWSI